MMERLSKLIDVKSIMTLVMTFAFLFLSCTGAIEPEQFLTIFTMIVSFYFGVQSQKNIDNKNN